jgi:hypothetical protein
MALIDVTELLADPDFVDALSITHRVPTVNSMGENSLTETTVETIGSVQPASGATLNRLPDALRVPNVNSFWIKGEIVSDGTNEYPDLIVYQGQNYEVQVVFDWMNWPGSNGWSEGTCVRQVISE